MSRSVATPGLLILFLIAAALLGFVKWTILFREDHIAAARRWVPALVGLMAGVFAMYLATKGLSRVWKPPFLLVITLGAAFFARGMLITHPWVQKHSQTMENRANM